MLPTSKLSGNFFYYYGFFMLSCFYTQLLDSFLSA
jgi:hypothetical protein